jgi:hypothetical protein
VPLEADRGGGAGDRKEKDRREDGEWRILVRVPEWDAKIWSNSAIFEKFHRKHDVSSAGGRIEQGDEMKGWRDVAGFDG